MKFKKGMLLTLIAVCWMAGSAPGLFAQAEENPAQVPGDAGKLLDTPSFLQNDDMTLAIKIVVIMSVLTLLPALVLTMTSFTRIMVILSFVKRAMGTQELPPNQVIVGFSIFLTLSIMAPVFVKINDMALEPYQKNELSLSQAGEAAADVIGQWLLKQTRVDDITLMMQISKVEAPASPKDTPLYVLVPAFALSELKTAFQMGFIIYLPFLVIDIVIASILLSMGMFMLPPIIISTPFKIILFVLVDGWTLVIASLVKSFGA